MNITTIGSFADHYLKHAQLVSVIGITSQGIFLNLYSDRVIFLTLAQVHGPLTANCDGDPDEFAEMRTKSSVIIRADRLCFPEAGFCIDRGQPKIWQAPPRLVSSFLADEYSDRAVRLINLLLSRHPDRWHSGLLSLFIAQESQDAITNQFKSIGDPLRSAMEQQQSERIVESLAHFLGLGNGLTPSGDDFVLGFALAINRWGDFVAPDIDRIQFNQHLLRKIYNETTTLSANLIECSLHGQADERLVTALDGLITGNLKIPIVVDYLEGWGNSSGMDAFAGMSFVIFKSFQVTHYPT